MQTHRLQYKRNRFLIALLLLTLGLVLMCPVVVAEVAQDALSVGLPNFAILVSQSGSTANMALWSASVNLTTTATSTNAATCVNVPSSNLVPALAITANGTSCTDLNGTTAEDTNNGALSAATVTGAVEVNSSIADINPGHIRGPSQTTANGQIGAHV